MLMTYLGALKSWIYAPLFRLWPPSVLSLRIPMVLLAALTVWLFYLLLRRVSHERAAVIGCVLLATDSSYLLTSVFDWGPVVLQHLCLVAGVLLLAAFAAKQSHRALFGACLLFGIGAWDKALFFWLLGGLGVALLAVYPREILRLCTFRRAALALCAFLIGALPLVVYNLNRDHRLATFHSNASFTADELGSKAHLARLSIEGTALFGWMVRENHEVENPRAPATALERASTWLSESTGHQRRGLLGWAFLFSLPLGLLMAFRHGWKGEVRVMAAALVFIAVAWLQMALTKNAGGAVHHAVLLWPAPHLVIALALGGIGRLPRGAVPAAAATALLAASSLLVTNQYYAQIARNGGALNWTDAVHPLADLARRTPARSIYVTDWGIFDTLRLLGRGSMPLIVATHPIAKPELDDADRRDVAAWFETPGHLFIGHTDNNEFFSGCRKNLLHTAALAGFRRELLATVPDRNGKPVFEVFRFIRSEQGAAGAAPELAPKE